MRAKLADFNEFDALIRASHVDLLCDISFHALSDTVTFGGSLVEGFGNIRSDIDVFIIVGKSERHVTRPYFYWSEAGRWVDVSYIASSFLSELFDEVSQRHGRFPSGFAEFRTLPLKNLDLLHRITAGLSCRSLPFPANIQPCLAAELCYVYIGFARSLWDDAVGAFQSEQFDQSIFACRLMIDQITDAYTAILGETYVGNKWRWAKLNRLGVDPLILKESLAHSSHYSGPGNSAIALQLLRSCGTLIFEVMHLAWKKVPSGLGPTDSPLSRREICDERIVLINSSGQIEFPN